MRKVYGRNVVVVLRVSISYVVVVLNGAKNPYRNAVALDIKNAILKTRAEKGTPATYWSQPEQETRLEEAYQKWSRHGGVWSAAAAKVSIQAIGRMSAYIELFILAI